MDELFLIILELFENFQKYFNRDKVKFALAIFLVIYLHFLVFDFHILQILIYFLSCMLVHEPYQPLPKIFHKKLDVNLSTFNLHQWVGYKEIIDGGEFYIPVGDVQIKILFSKKPVSLFINDMKIPSQQISHLNIAVFGNIYQQKVIDANGDLFNIKILLRGVFQGGVRLILTQESFDEMVKSK